jgi:Tol biopolymer transport system component
VKRAPIGLLWVSVPCLAATVLATACSDNGEDAQDEAVIKTTAPARFAVTSPALAAQRLVYGRRVGHNDLVMMTADGDRVRAVVGGSIRSRELVPSGRTPASWSPDGRQLVFERDLKPPKEGDLYVLEVRTGDVRRLTTDGVSGNPIWSPDGETIVFTKLTDPGSDVAGASLWAMGADGSEPRQVTEEQDLVSDIAGSFSPGGASLAFTRYIGPTGFTRAIYTVGLDGSDPELLAEESSDPAYSPDGETIAFSSFRDQNGEIGFGDFEYPAGELYAMNADGTEPSRLTETRDVDELLPSWSYDGERIAYQREVGFQNTRASVVVVVNPDGSCRSPIAIDHSHRKGKDYRAPSWRPGSDPGPLSC